MSLCGICCHAAYRVQTADSVIANNIAASVLIILTNHTSFHVAVISLASLDNILGNSFNRDW